MDSSQPSDPPPDYITAAAQHGIPLRQSAPIRRGPRPLELPILDYLKSKRVILASGSPRRKFLLSQIGLSSIEIMPSTKPEDLDKTTLDPYEYVSATARQKCLDVYETALEQQEKAASSKSSDKTSIPSDPDVVIAADTVVVSADGQILEKPTSEDDHVRMLTLLRDTRVHRVLTTVCALAPRADARYPGYSLASHTDESKVYFVEADAGLPDDVIQSYVRTREGADKAGGYAVQGVGGLLLVEKIDGAVDNIIGLPVRKCLQLCEKVVFQQDAEDDEAEDDEELV